MVHNRYAETGGFLRDGELKPGPALIDILRVDSGCDADLCFYDRITGARVIQPAADIRRRGLHFRFKAYGHHLLEFQGIRDSRRPDEKAENSPVEISPLSEYSDDKAGSPCGGEQNGKKNGKKTEEKKPDPGG